MLLCLKILIINKTSFKIKFGVLSISTSYCFFKQRKKKFRVFSCVFHAYIIEKFVKPYLIISIILILYYWKTVTRSINFNLTFFCQFIISMCYSKSWESYVTEEIFFSANVILNIRSFFEALLYYLNLPYKILFIV